MNKSNIILALLLLLSGTSYSQSDCEGCKDYELLERLPNYHIIDYKESEFGSEEFKIDGERKQVEGHRIQIQYKHNRHDQKDFEFPSRLQILRNHSNAVNTKAGSVLHESRNNETGMYYLNNHNNKEIWFKVSGWFSGKRYKIVVIEREKMNQDISISADFIKDRIDLFGKVEIQGIFFDVGKATIREESTPALIEIAKYLKENPSNNCWVVGHTDSDGSFEINSKLSLQRSQAIKTELESSYGIAKNRLFAEGVGPLAPVASNNSEEGKQKNRRVELVLK